MIHSLLFISSWLASEPEIETLEDKNRTYKTGFEMTTWCLSTIPIGEEFTKYTHNGDLIMQYV